MQQSCDNEKIYKNIQSYMETLALGMSLSGPQERKMRVMLDQYWGSQCPAEKLCTPKDCLWAMRTSLATGLGYTDTKDLLDHFDYDVSRPPLQLVPKPVKLLKKIDALDAPRRPGHFNT